MFFYLYGGWILVRTPAVVISGYRGKIGKTSITMGIIEGLKRMGLRVQPFKIGPDFIDPSYHSLLAGRECRNLDSVMFTRRTLVSQFIRNTRDADIAVVEGVFGLYDSYDGITEAGSTAEVAKIIKAPVILILSAERTNRGLAAVLKGFLSFDREVRIRGVIVNNIANEKQRDKIERILKDYGVEIVGMIRRDEEIERIMGYRHLGLIPIEERREEERRIEEMARRISEQIDLKKVLEIAEEAEEIEAEPETSDERRVNVKVGVIKDRAFSFYYPENIEFIQAHSDRVYFIDSLNDKILPEIDLLYVGGGFPEVYAPMLSRNEELLREIRSRYERGRISIYAECGGLMLMCDNLVDLNGKEHKLIGIIDGDVFMERKPVGHGYVRLKTVKDTIFAKKGDTLVGHEFHHSRLKLRGEESFAYEVIRGHGIDGRHDGIVKDRFLASYTHVHVLHNREVFLNLLLSSADIK
ncbi:cobyrinate a,c-diamide synthase [Candidatus Methanodesulfokora washburnensis]|jgi:cobyrinic acid a,c-diamide synthase|uniref:Cobyrinate a,c-diamide synthase n=1 Tax=Candidatus Methanodesulfokora washburnensis TaxID=2478471 RepID=A0A429GH43_9CREN|nr:cobyrinate a,c-diamide synthase [Candidatus Methanodesulfokores washburnensis]RSN73124.1 hydrogenobyrinic acid a,c-diamide synthase (glutamine-hydrolyzing) [Candidatus Methanodesulfokores washburnensis]